MENQQNPSFFQRNATMLKGLLIGFLVLLLLIPTFMIDSLVSEREGRKAEAVAEVSSKWGNAQTLAGPILRVPYTNANKETEHVYFLPEKLSIKTEIKPEKRYRGIFEVVVYQSKIKCSGTFTNLSSTIVAGDRLYWKNAELMVGLSDLRGVSDEVMLSWNAQKQLMNPSGSISSVSSAGMTVPVVLSSDGKNDFEFEIALKGSQTFHVIPVGKTTDVTMQSPWQNPSFGGAFLPAERNITDKGFTASWRVLHLNRNFPQQWISSAAPNISDASFGVELFTPNDGYQQTSRSVKYAILVIALTFMVFFFNEMLNKKRIHPFQYILIGLALCIFYTLLLSISEYLNFNWAYGIASAMTLGLVFWYSKSILGENRPAIIILLLMGLLYGFIFTIIQLEDAALLVGTLGLFAILAVVMYISKKIDWYGR